MPGEHGIVEKMIVVAGIAFFVIAALYGIYILVKFWMSFAEGINEANPKPKGFEVRPIATEEEETQAKT
jgi:hypothetical protein